MARCSRCWTFQWNNDGHHHGHPTSNLFLPQLEECVNIIGSGYRGPLFIEQTPSDSIRILIIFKGVRVSILQHTLVLYCTALYCTALYCTVLV